MKYKGQIRKIGSVIGEFNDYTRIKNECYDFTKNIK